MEGTAASYDDGLDDEELQFQRRYGPWAAWTPLQARVEFDAIGLTWWVAGGWAIEAFTGRARHHEDIDISLWRRDVTDLVRALEGRYHVWAAGPDGLTPLYDERLEPPERADQVWLRAHALAPWRADCLLNPDRDGRWRSRRDPAFDAPLDEVTFEAAGVRYLRPEFALTFKAKLVRPKDQRDFEACLPLLDDQQRRFLAGYLDRFEPSHPWRPWL